MKRRTAQNSEGAAAILLCGGALGLIAVVAFILVSGRSATPTRDVEAVGAERVLQLSAWSAALAVSFLLFLVFLTGSYLLVRAMRRARAPDSRSVRTPYVDAWRRYRLSDEDVDRATREDGGGGRIE